MVARNGFSQVIDSPYGRLAWKVRIAWLADWLEGMHSMIDWLRISFAWFHVKSHLWLAFPLDRSSGPSCIAWTWLAFSIHIYEPWLTAFRSLGSWATATWVEKRPLNIIWTDRGYNMGLGLLVAVIFWAIYIDSDPFHDFIWGAALTKASMKDL